MNPTWVNFAAEGLRDSDVKVCTVIGFPLGANTPFVKACETKNAIQNGADEIDMVINIGALKSKNLALVEEDIQAVVEASGDKLVKVIIETCLLTDDEKVVACQIAKVGWGRLCEDFNWLLNWRSNGRRCGLNASEQLDLTWVLKLLVVLALMKMLLLLSKLVRPVSELLLV